MTARFIADGSTGKVAIQSSRSRFALDNPSEALGQLFFHSDLSYLSLVGQFQVTALTLPQTEPAFTTITFDDKKEPYSQQVPVPTRGVRTYMLGSAQGAGDDVLIGFYNAQGATYQLNDLVPGGSGLTGSFQDPTGTLQIGSSVPVGSYRHPQAGYAVRNVYARVVGNDVVLVEKYFTFGMRLPSQIINNIRVGRFRMMGESGGSTTLSMSPTRFIASNGKLDSALRYIYRQDVGAPYCLMMGKTIYDEGGDVLYCTMEGYRAEFGVTTTPAQPFEAFEDVLKIGIGF